MTSLDSIPAPAFGCVNNTIRLRSGRYLDLADPRPADFTFADIAGALSKVCRFGGQVPTFYSVAEHLVHCGRLALADGLPGDAVRAALMHDATEAFVGDVVKPLKVMLPEYGRIEAAVERAVGLKFGIDFGAHAAAVRKIDREMLIAERRALFSADDVKWAGEDLVRVLNVSFDCWSPEAAERRFANLAASAGLNTWE
ncbi:MAG TPA: hypothetical protein VM597_40420 [Gemmataceae bacterium]|nr:hypothetical protein [Gemmataceae bacterium]